MSAAHIAPQRSPRPRTAARAVQVYWASLGLQALSSVLDLLNLRELARIEFEAASKDPELAQLGLTPDLVEAVLLGSSLFNAALTAALPVLFVWLFGRGRAWARIVLTVFAVFAVVSIPVQLLSLTPASALSTAVSVLGFGLFAGATALAWSGEASAWLKDSQAGSA